MYGDGSSRRDYTYIDDLIEGIMDAIHRHKGYEIYNLGESQTTSLKELIHLIEESLGGVGEYPNVGTPTRRCFYDLCRYHQGKADVGLSPKNQNRRGDQEICRVVQKIKPFKFQILNPKSQISSKSQFQMIKTILKKLPSTPWRRSGFTLTVAVFNFFPEILMPNTTPLANLLSSQS